MASRPVTPLTADATPAAGADAVHDDPPAPPGRRRGRSRERSLFADVEREARRGTWATRMLCVGVLGGLAQVVGLALVRGTDHVPGGTDAGSALGPLRQLFENAPLGAGLVAGGTAVMVPVALMFLVWLYRAMANARALGLPERHRPGLIILGFCIPVVNLFVPYRAAAGLFESTDRHRRGAAGWWTRLLAAQAGLVAMVLLDPDPRATVIAVGIATFLAYLGSAWSARRLVAGSIDAHRGLVSSTFLPVLVPHEGSLRRGDLPDDAAVDAAWQIFVTVPGRRHRRRRRPKLS